ncbi:MULTISPECIES: single-stranded DNA-binding protein [unclassified Clostridium]|uniref:single-stranded DNA-binding protein n=1 Tax=unclassified Clostridium TaxID=2614128 RepID=UPI003F8FB099
MNRVMLIGRLTKDAELKYIEDRDVSLLRFVIAVNRYYNKENSKTDYIPVVVWGRHAEAIHDYMNKGKLISVVGRIQTRNYEDKSGNKRYGIEIVSNEIKFLDPKKIDKVVNN